MKKLLVIMLALTFILGITAVAVASQGGGGYARTSTGTAAQWQSDAGGTLHGSYASSTNQCKGCHAVHDADTSNAFKLLANNTDGTVAGACKYCHDNSSGLVSNRLVYKGGTAASHAIDASNIPDSSNGGSMLGSEDKLDCRDCHRAAPHGAASGGYAKLTRYDLTSNGGINNFCGSCHDQNSDDVEGGSGNGSSHLLTSSVTEPVRNGVTIAFANTPKCTSCHIADQVSQDALDDFPHSSNNNARFLKSAATSSNLAGVCEDCHTKTGFGSSGVGDTF